jgi:nucleoid-associated protein YgaU
MAAGGATAGGAPEPDVFDPPARPASTPPASSRDWNLILAREQSENPAPAMPRTRAPASNRGSDAPAPPDSSAATANARVSRADTAGTERIGASIFNGTRTPGDRNYVVKSGETLISIARAHYGNSRHYLHIMKANPNVDPESMKPGTRLVLPDLSSLPAPRTGTGGTAFQAAAEGANAGLRPVDPKMEYRIQSGDSLARISQRLYGTETKVDALYNANRDTIGPDREKLKLGTVLRLPEPPTATASR